MARGSRLILSMTMGFALVVCGACGGGGATDTPKKEPAGSVERVKGKEVPSEAEQESRKGFVLKSSDFAHHGGIPAKFTCDGQGMTPNLEWEGVPDNVKSFVIVVDDADAAQRSYLQWLVYNVPGDARSLKEGVAPGPTVAGLAGAVQTANGSGKLGWEPPCPPAGRPHRFVFRIYALDTVLDLKGTPTRQQVEDAWKGHFLGQAGIIASYGRAAKG